MRDERTIKLLYFTESLVDEKDQKALDDIEEFGCHVINVMEGEEESQFTYSIGINQKQYKADLIVVGLKRELAHSIVNNYKDRMLAGESFKLVNSILISWVILMYVLSK